MTRPYPRLMSLPALSRGTACVLIIAGIAGAPAAQAQGPNAATDRPKSAAKPSAKHSTPRHATTKKPAAAAPVVVPPAASPEQIDASERVYYGVHDCEFKQSMDVSADTQYPGYVDLKFGKATYVMKPVLSSTGAIRLEDVKGEMLLVQIAQKSMLMNTKSGNRVLDDCVSAAHRKAVEAAQMALAAAAAAASAPPPLDGASAPTSSLLSK